MSRFCLLASGRRDEVCFTPSDVSSIRRLLSLWALIDIPNPWKMMIYYSECQFPRNCGAKVLKLKGAFRKIIQEGPYGLQKRKWRLGKTVSLGRDRTARPQGSRDWIPGLRCTAVSLPLIELMSSSIRLDYAIQITALARQPHLLPKTMQDVRKTVTQQNGDVLGTAAYKKVTGKKLKRIIGLNGLISTS